MLRCTLHAYGTAPHVSQIFTGYTMLAASGKIALSQTLKHYIPPGSTLSPTLPHDQFSGCFVVLNDKTTIFYDAGDRPTLRADVLSAVDFYFKRSFVPALIPDEYRARAFPLGLNYEVYMGRPLRFELSRHVLRRHLLGQPRTLVRRLMEVTGLTFHPTLRNTAAAPEPDRPPRVLFMARAWDPDADPPDLPDWEKQERAALNDMRAGCIRALRLALGDRFYGGFAHTPFARARYADALIDDDTFTSKARYFERLRQHSICVASTGLHGSLGWKLGEYVARSKAILSEEIHQVLPGEFRDGVNYLSFRSPDECVEQAVRLMEAGDERKGMMAANWTYYNTCLRPDLLVSRTLELAGY